MTRSRSRRSRQTRPPHRAYQQRSGVTLVELLVAMTILTIGLMAIAGVSGAIARSLGEARSDNLAAMAAQTRFEKMAGTACTSLGTLGSWTTVTSRGVTEKYAVADGGNNTRSVTDSVSWVTRKGTRKYGFSTLLPCRTGA